jgi:hypothetical protein
MKNGKFKSFAVPQATVTICSGINNEGVIVGSFWEEFHYMWHGFMIGPITDADFQ